MERQIIKKWSDPVTAITEINRIAEEYTSQGYDCKSFYVDILPTTKVGGGENVKRAKV